MNYFIRVLKIQLISVGVILFAIFFVMILPIVFLQNLGYGAHTKSALIILTSLLLSIFTYIGQKYFMKISKKPKAWFIVGIIVFIFSLPLSWFVYSLGSLDLDVGKVINVEMIGNTLR